METTAVFQLNDWTTISFEQGSITIKQRHSSVVLRSGDIGRLNILLALQEASEWRSSLIGMFSDRESGPFHDDWLQEFLRPTPQDQEGGSNDA